MDQIREALEGLEFIQALRGLQFQLEVQSLFDPWDMVEGHLEQELNITAQSVQSLAQSYLDLPKVSDLGFSLEKIDSITFHLWILACPGEQWAFQQHYH